jgi:hypothetical protein
MIFETLVFSPLNPFDPADSPRKLHQEEDCYIIIIIIIIMHV